MYMYKEGSEKLVSSNEVFYMRTAFILALFILMWMSMMLPKVFGGSIVDNDFEYLALNERPILNSEYSYYFKKNLNSLKLKDSNFDGVNDLDNKYDEDITYGDYIDILTVDSLRKKYVLMDDMLENDFKVSTISDEEILISEEAKYKASSLKDTLSFEGYLKEVYGDTMSKKKLIQLAKEDKYISKYEKHLINKGILDDDEIVKKYKNNPEYYYTIDYIEYNLGSGINDEEAKALFDSISTKTDFINLIKDIEGDQVDIEEYKESHLGMYSVGDKIKSDWLYSKDRKPNSMAMLKNDDETYSILMYLSKEMDRSEGWTFRSIFIPSKSFKSVDERKAKTKEIVEEFRDNNSTEVSFIDLANKYSVNEGNTSNKNYYERIFEKDVIIDPEVVSFLKAAKPGDLKTIHLDKGSYIILFKEKTGERWLEYLIGLEESQNYEDVYKDLFNKNKSQVGLYDSKEDVLKLDEQNYIKYSFIENIK